jgi:hypothetical protein
MSLRSNKTLAVKKYGYGPIPEEQSVRAFWKEKAIHWKMDYHYAMLRRCGTCSYYDTSKAMKKEGLASEDGSKGFCVAHEFVAELSKVCNTWVPVARLNPFTRKQAETIGRQLGVNFHRIPLSEWHAGMNVELEHGAHDSETDVTHDDAMLTGKIAWAHLKELSDYYTRLKKMEKKR